LEFRLGHELAPAVEANEDFKTDDPGIGIVISIDACYNDDFEVFRPLLKMTVCLGLVMTGEGIMAKSCARLRVSVPNHRVPRRLCLRRRLKSL
jgi:hypothetical protein